jgi:hypothetical protein
LSIEDLEEINEEIGNYNLKPMKSKILLIAMVIMLIASCKKENPDPVIDHSIVGQTYSGYYFKSIVDGSDMYIGYKFISKTRCLDLLLEGNSRIVSSKEVGYTLNYPNIKIEGENAKDGFWNGIFESNGNLTISGVIMKKW